MQNLYQRSMCLFAVLALFGGAAAGSTRPALYFTGALGGSETTSTWDINTAAQFVTPTTINSHTILSYQNSADEDIEDGVGQVGIGFGMRFMERLFLGFEASIAANSSNPVVEDNGGLTEVLQSESPTFPLPATAKMDSSTTLSVLNPDIYADIKLGVHVSPYSMVYLKGGAAFNKLELESNTSFLFDNPIVKGPPFHSHATLNAVETQDVTGIHIALGIEHLVSRYLAVNAEYVYVHYGDISVEGVAPTTSVSPSGGEVIVIDDGLTANSSAIVTKQSVMLGLVLYMGRQY